MSSPVTPKKRKSPDVSDEDDTPSTKKRAMPKPRGKKAVPVQVDEEEQIDMPCGDDVPEDAADFIKIEQDWENEFV